MKAKTTVIAAALFTSSAAIFASGAYAQSAASESQRDAGQQDRIEQGLKSGSLSTGEAAQLERGESRIDRMESRDLKDGSLSASEKARIQSAQNREGSAISRDEHNNVTGNPNSRSDKRMQGDVARDAKQEQRIANGDRSGQLTNRETAQLERGQSRDDRAEAHAGADGHVGFHEQAGIQHSENRQNGSISSQKHDDQTRR